MSFRGPAPKPVALRVIDGNPSKRPLPNTPEPSTSDEVPAPPKHLGTEARRFWRKVAPELHRLGMLTEVDLAAFERLSESYGLAVQAMKDIKKNGPIEVASVFRKDGEVSGERRQKNPAIQVWRDSTTLFKALAAEFGITPATRARFNVPDDADGSGDFAAILD